MNYLESKLEEKNNSKEITKKEIFSLPKSIGATHFCTCCGSPLEKGDVFCSECGIKIEDEDLVAENCEIVEQNPIRISSDRMASILETNKIKKGEGVEEFRKNSLIEKLDDSNSKNFSLCGYYVRKDSNMTQYLIIDSVEGNQIKAQIKRYICVLKIQIYIRLHRRFVLIKELLILFIMRFNFLKILMV